MAAPTNGFPFPSRGSGRKEPYAHVDDLTSVTVDLDPHTPLRKVLETGDACMRQALTFGDFGRKDLALREYIKAFTIAVEKIPKHKDYPSVKNDRSDLGRLYIALKTNITKHSERFDGIKAEIREDNQRSGVQSKKSASDALLMNLPSVPTSIPNRLKPNGANGTAPKVPNATENDVQTRPRNGSASSPQRSKPAIHPKPQALHGNTIKPTTNGVAQDLASRFAKLRVNQDGQAGAQVPGSQADLARSKDMSTPSRPQPRVNSSIPAMPKLPDAIYSPARGTVTSEVADLPSSTPRGMFSRTNSIASVAPSSARNSIDIGVRPMNTESFMMTSNTSVNAPATTPVSPRIQVPSGTSITPEQLREYMQKGASVVRLLLIDVRSREEFDNGHIMSQNTICIEPSVLTRGHISAEDIEESMGIAPDEEMRAFENRAKFDLVVLYDEDSTILPERPQQDDQATALFTLFQGLDQFNYGRELRNKPKLLRGGVEAWADLFGRHSLQESKTSVAVRQGQSRPDLSRFKPGYINKRRARAQTKALKPEEIKEFEKKIQEDEAAAQSPQDFVRSTADFLRRFPSTSEIQESMTAPAVSQAQFETDLPPAPPSRPAPSVPRTSYSGLSSRTSADDVVPSKGTLTETPLRDRPTGLINPHMNCFANSAIQAILASPSFATELARKEWADQWKPASPTPQLMSRILGNLIEWLAGRQFDSMQPTTFMKYCQSIHQGYRLPGSGRLFKFGDGTQHDSSEFLFDFVFSQLDNETNRSRDTAFVNYSQPGEDLKKANKEKARSLSPTDLALESWRLYTSFRDTIMTAYWGVLHVDRNICQTCRDSVDSFGYSNYLDLGITGSDSDSYLSLRELLDEQYNTKEIRKADGGTGYECGTEIGECHMSKEAFTKLARLPPLLAIRFKRWDYNGSKILRKIKFEVENLDLGKYTLDHSDNPKAAKVDGFGKERLYDLYAVITHGGASSNGGHYIAHVRDNSDKEGVRWFVCNDKDVYRRVVGSRTNTPLERDWYDCANKFTPFVIFYKRKDVPWSYAKASPGLK